MENKVERLAEIIQTAIENIWADYYKEEGIQAYICPLEILPYLDNIEDIADMIYRAGESKKNKNKEELI